MSLVIGLEVIIIGLIILFGAFGVYSLVVKDWIPFVGFSVFTITLFYILYHVVNSF